MVTVLVATTNALGVHRLFWTDYRTVETFGAAVRALDPQPWVYVKSTYATVLIGAGMLMFVEEMVIERTLDRRQSLLVLAATGIPLSGYTVWLLGVGPAEHVDFSALLLAVSPVGYGYAVFGADLFETAPAVRRLGRRDALRTLGEAVVIVSDEGVVTELNPAAAGLLGRRQGAALGEPLNELLDGGSVDFDDPGSSLTLRTADGVRTFRITVDPMVEDGTPVGHTVLLSDVTERRRREQRLEVLNRIVRHNLRNDLGTVLGYSDLIREHSDDEQVTDWAVATADAADGLLELGEKARDFESALDAAATDRTVELRQVVDEVAEQFRTEHPAAAVDADVPVDLRVRGSPSLLRLVVRNLVENAVEHHDSDAPTIEIGTGPVPDGGEPESIVLTVADDGPGIPETELATLREGSERPLQHGQGIGLWLVQWSVSTLGGTVSFDSGDAGTTVTVTLPATRPVPGTGG